MKNKERMLYQNNDAGYSLTIGFIITNIVYTIFTLNAMERTAELGIFVMLTIVLLLAGFLIAIKVRIYSVSWSVIGICVGVFQPIRLLFTHSNIEGLYATLLNIVLVISGVFCFSGGLLSLKKSLHRSKLK